MINLKGRGCDRQAELSRLLEEISASSDVGSVGSALSRAADHLEADWYSAMSFDSVAPGTFPTRSIIRYPAGYFDRANEDLPNCIDPVMERCRRSTPPPIHWNQDTYVDVDLGPHWEVMSGTGVSEGVTCVLHLGPRRHFVAGFTWRMPFKKNASRSPFEVESFLLSIAVALEPVMFKMKTGGCVEPLERLTNRELEALGFAFRGHTDKQIASALGTTGRTASKHIQGCISKLRAANRTDAVAKGLQLGLIP